MPSIPTVYTKVAAIANNPGSSIRDLSKAIEEDQAIAANTLKIANSAAFGARSRVASLEQACGTLGMLRVKGIVLQSSLMSHYSKINVPGFDLDRFWRHTSFTALIARTFAPYCQSRIGIKPDEAFTCGLLHDIGIVVMLDSFPSAYMEALQRANDSGIELETAESEIFGFNHAEVGAALAQSWKLPAYIGAAARWHHEIPEDVPHENICCLIALSNQIAESFEAGAKPFELQEPLGSRVLDLLGLISHDIAKELVQIAELAPSFDSH